MLNVLFKACDVVLRVVGGVSIATLLLTVKNGGTLELKCTPKEERESKD